MRLSFFLLVAAATLLTGSDLASAISSSELASSTARQSHKAASVATAEERAAEEMILDAKILANILSDHNYAKQVFRRWLQNGQSKEDIEERLKTQGLFAKYGSVVTQYGQYLTVLEGKSV
ncbi:unnamed protein product [Phytophthora fragariaefolia]|uniref:RxLR effector protein n=1 Tax=Phytophthora fragariaefolia TaxID=1490495 RepID=A0A9W6XTY4_9STRA|nr:unnamed protein product [Phytophthora fragariaefolia]